MASLTYSKPKALLWLVGLASLISTTTYAEPAKIRTSSYQAEALTSPILDDSTIQSLITEALDNSRATTLPGWVIDTNNRQLVRGFYNSVYLSSLNTPISWTGNHSTCSAGTTGVSFKQAVLNRINYFRAMAGVPATVALDATFSAKAQQAALMMSFNKTLNHYPPNTWGCYTLDGAQAAGNSNLSLGSNAWDAVNGQMRDNGTYNTATGHRRWLLLPQAQNMGTGDIPATTNYPAANAVWVPLSAMYNARPATRDTFVAWPTKGYNPYNIVPIRWSFSYPQANFANATISMTQAGQAVPLTIDSRVNGYGENTIVWRPYNRIATSDWPKPTTDTSYQVLISNVLIGGVARSFSYTVNVFDPSTPAVGELLPSIRGSAQPIAGVANSYGFNSIAIAQRYDAYVAELTTAPEIFTAETTSPSVIAGNHSSYSLIYTDTSTNKAYRLAPATESERFTLPYTYLPSSTSVLQFDSKLGYATTGQVAAIQISTDNGASWKDIYSKTGTSKGSPEELVFSAKAISLAAYANKIIRIRAEFRHNGYRYIGTDGAVSFLVDNVRISNAKKVVSPTIYSNLTTSFSFTPTFGKAYIMAARAVPWSGFAGLDWGPLLYVTPILGSAKLATPVGTITTRTPSYNWQAVPGATQYLIWVNTAGQQGKIQTWYTSQQANCSTDTSCTVSPTILASGSSSWKIQARNGTSYGAWSSLNSFTAP